MPDFGSITLLGSDQNVLHLTSNSRGDTRLDLNAKVNVNFSDSALGLKADNLSTDFVVEIKKEDKDPNGIPNGWVEVRLENIAVDEMTMLKSSLPALGAARLDKATIVLRYNLKTQRYEASMKLKDMKMQLPLRHEREPLGASAGTRKSIGRARLTLRTSSV